MSNGDKMKTACVTGGSGYIASALIKMLLEKGYTVKTTVRNPDDMAKNSHLKDLQALGHPLTVLHADLEKEGSFDKAVAGCDYAFLVAVPVNLASGEDPEGGPGGIRHWKEVIEPAVRGTLNVMRSCVKAGTVRRVVLTSSVSSVYFRPELQAGDGHVLDEDSWSDVDYLRAQKPPSWGYRYCASKVLVEEAACRFAAEHGVSLVTVLPVITVGAAPSLNVNTSVPACLSLLSGRSSGRYICCGLSTTVVELARFLAHKYPQYDVERNLRTVDDQLLEKPRACLSSAKLVREGFEFKHKTLDEIYDNVVEYGKALGILPK